MARGNLTLNYANNKTIFNIAKSLLVLILYLIASLSYANTNILELNIDESNSTINLAPYINILEDKTGNIDSLQIPEQQAEFEPFGSLTTEIGYSLSTWWLKFQVVNTSPEALTRFIQIQGQDTFAVQAFIESSDIPKPPTQIPLIKYNRQPTFELYLPPDVPYTVYLKIRDYNDRINFIPVITTPKELIATTAPNHAFYSFIIGGMFAMGFYNLLIFLTLREPSYLNISVFIFVAGLDLATHTGMIYMLATIIWKPINFTTLFAILTIASGNRFFFHLMNLKHRLPNIANWFKYHYYLCLILIPLHVFLPYSSFLNAVMGLSLMVLATPAIYILLKQRIPEAKSFVISFLVILFGSLPIVAYNLGLTNNIVLASDILNIGLFTFTILLSITQGKRAQQLQAQAQRMAIMNKAKDDFLATMNHELRTPMHAVVSSGILLRKTELNIQQRDYVEKLETSAQHMLNLINDILDVTQLNNSQDIIQPLSFKIRNMLSNLEHLVSEQAKQKDIQLIIANECPIDLKIIGDSTRLSQILLNLLTNAIKFTDNNGQVKLILRPKLLNADEIILEFNVTDTGIGLTPEDQVHLFEPFYQIQSNNKQVQKGSGLGLTISKGLVERMGGSLEILSIYGKGSQFYFTLNFPVDNSKLENISPPPLLTKDYHSAHILLVDDDHLNQFFGKKLLKTLEVEVSTVNGGQEAINFLKQQSCDLVFMDISMPDIDGYETTRIIRRHLGVTIPIIAVTAHGIIGERERCLAAGMNDYLPKPFNTQSLEEILQRWIIKPST